MSEPRAVPERIAGPAAFLDERLGAGGFARRNIRKIFPDHWSSFSGRSRCTRSSSSC